MVIYGISDVFFNKGDVLYGPRYLSMNYLLV